MDFQVGTAAAYSIAAVATYFMEMPLSFMIGSALSAWSLCAIKLLTR